MRKTIAMRLVESKKYIPHFYLSITCVLDELLAVRIKINEALYECARYDPKPTNNVEDTPPRSRKRKAASGDERKRVGGRGKVPKQRK
jgi:hypothetical protein